MFSVFRSFAPYADEIRVTLTHLSELNLIVLRRVFLALIDTGPGAAGRASAARIRREDIMAACGDLIDVLADTPEITERLPPPRVRGIAEEVWRQSSANAERAACVLAAVPGLKDPRRLDELTDEEIVACEGAFIPGGHGPMADLAHNPGVGRVLELLHGADLPIAALCHGPAALLSVPDSDGVWLFDGYKMTAFTNEEEDQTPVGRTGPPWSLEDALKNRGAVFDDGDAAWASHVVVDRNLITAQNPRSSAAGANALLERLGA